MTQGQNKNKSYGHAKLLKLTDRKKAFSWKNILFNLVFLTSIFKDCLIYIQNKEIYILTFTSTELLASLQEASLRKASKLDDIGPLFNMYGDCHAYAIFWTVKENAKIVPKCLETSKLFKNIVKETTETLLATSVEVCVELDSLIGDGRVNKRKLHKDGKEQWYNVYVTNDFSYNNNGFAIDQNIGKNRLQKYKEIPISLTRKAIKRKSKVISSNLFKFETVIPFTGLENERTQWPQQVSGEQESEDQSTIVFSNGASFRPLPGNHYQTAVPTTIADRAIPRYPEYTKFEDRIRSYVGWVHRKPDQTQLSQAGFFFTGQDDLVRCYQCGIGLKDFSEGDNPLHEHVLNSRQCSFLLEFLGYTQLSSLLNQLQARDPEIIRQRQLEVSRGTRPELNYTVRHPEYQSLESRLRSFDKWPRHLIQTPRQLAEAGLYYTGFEDHVRCFSCDGGLRRWDPEDDPWTEHCRWFPACPFARVEKGDNFIALVQASADYENEQGNSEDLSNTMQQMTLRDPVYNAALNEHKDACLEMGYALADFNDAVQEIRDRGTVLPHIDEILDTIEVIKERKRQELLEKEKQNETPIEENQRLKRLVICMLCSRNKVNALFLPCSHHRLCMQCAELLTSCPVCGRNVRQKIRTYLI